MPEVEGNPVWEIVIFREVALVAFSVTSAVRCAIPVFFAAVMETTVDPEVPDFWLKDNQLALELFMVQISASVVTFISEVLSELSNSIFEELVASDFVLTTGSFSEKESELQDKKPMRIKIKKELLLLKLLFIFFIFNLYGSKLPMKYPVMNCQFLKYRFLFLWSNHFLIHCNMLNHWHLIE